jgi:hypothetical protein
LGAASAFAVSRLSADARAAPPRPSQARHDRATWLPPPTSSTRRTWVSIGRPGRSGDDSRGRERSTGHIDRTPPSEEDSHEQRRTSPDGRLEHLGCHVRRRRPGRGARLLHREAGLGGAWRHPLRRERRDAVARGGPTRLTGAGGALNPPMGEEPGGSTIGVGTADVQGEHARLTEIGGVDLDPEPMRPPGAPLMFGLRDPDGNRIYVVEDAG